jgi:hypothetical protein
VTFRASRTGAHGTSTRMTVSTVCRPRREAPVKVSSSRRTRRLGALSARRRQSPCC